MGALATDLQNATWLTEDHPGERRCGACLFILPTTAKPISFDVSADPWNRAFEDDSDDEADEHRVPIENLRESVERGCANCRSTLSYLGTSGVLDRGDDGLEKLEAIEWWPEYSPVEGGILGNPPLARPILWCRLDDGGQVEFEVCTDNGNDHDWEQGVDTLRAVHPSICPGSKLDVAGTGGVSALRQARSWLDKCRETHPGCRRREELVSGFVPTRLLFIGNNPTDGDAAILLPLYIHGSVNSEPVIYAALSHSRG